MQAKLASEGEFDKVTHALAGKRNSHLKYAISCVVQVSTRIFIKSGVGFFSYLFGFEVLEILFETSCFSHGYGGWAARAKSSELERKYLMLI